MGAKRKYIIHGCVIDSLPISVNAMYRTNRHSMIPRKTDEATVWEDIAALRLKAVTHVRDFAGGVGVTVVLRAPDIFKWDTDNRLKCLLDALTRSKVIKDDRYVTTIEISKYRSKKTCTMVDVWEDPAWTWEDEE